MSGAAAEARSRVGRGDDVPEPADWGRVAARRGQWPPQKALVQLGGAAVRIAADGVGLRSCRSSGVRTSIALIFCADRGRAARPGPARDWHIPWPAPRSSRGSCRVPQPRRHGARTAPRDPVVAAATTRDDLLAARRVSVLKALGRLASEAEIAEYLEPWPIPGSPARGWRSRERRITATLSRCCRPCCSRKRPRNRKAGGR
jgi:hypothetical protein